VNVVANERPQWRREPGGKEFACRQGNALAGGRAAKIVDFVLAAVAFEFCIVLGDVTDRMRSPICRQNQASVSVSFMRRQPKRTFQRMRSKTKLDSTY
jgi:hypothetical protein